MSNAYWTKSRKIAERIIISGDLKFITPVAFSSGNDEGLVDISLITDPLEGKALLTGSTLAGALRSYLREYEHGYRKEEQKGDLCSTFFGAHHGDEGSEQSWVITNDSLGDVLQVELRDGVKINPKTNTAEDKKKFDFEVLKAGCVFPLIFEVMVPEQKELRDKVLQGLVICLEGLEKKEILFGIRRNRGFGECIVETWKVERYVMNDPDGLIGWLKSNDSDEDDQSPGKPKKIRKALSGIEDLDNLMDGVEDARKKIFLDATFGIDGSLLIRSSSIKPNEPDVIQLKSTRGKKDVPILSGTSFAGALRARGLKIAKTMGDEEKAIALINDLFGNEDTSDGTDGSSKAKMVPSASKIVVAETEIENGLEMVQNRIRIDRFTGGAFPNALFNEQPIFGTRDTKISIQLLMKGCSDAQVGLMLLLLKDLWTGDLPIGGGVSIGRGRLKGKKAELFEGNEIKWTFENKNGTFVVEGDSTKLNDYVSAFLQEVRQ